MFCACYVRITYWATPFMVSAMRPRDVSTSITLTRTFCPMLTTSAGDEMNLSLSWEMWMRPFSFIPRSTKTPKAVMLLTLPVSSWPMWRSSIFLTASSYGISSAVSRGSRPGFSSSRMMSVRVGRPTSLVTYLSSSMLWRRLRSRVSFAMSAWRRLQSARQGHSARGARLCCRGDSRRRGCGGSPHTAGRLSHPCATRSSAVRAK